MIIVYSQSRIDTICGVGNVAKKQARERRVKEPESEQHNLRGVLLRWRKPGTGVDVSLFPESYWAALPGDPRMGDAQGSFSKVWNELQQALEEVRVVAAHPDTVSDRIAFARFLGYAISLGKLTERMLWKAEHIDELAGHGVHVLNEATGKARRVRSKKAAQVDELLLHQVELSDLKMKKRKSYNALALLLWSRKENMFDHCSKCRKFWEWLDEWRKKGSRGQADTLSKRIRRAVERKKRRGGGV